MRRALRLVAVTALLLALPLPAAGPAPPSPPPTDTCAPLCHCRGDHLSCNLVPFHRFPHTNAGVRHVSVVGARLGALGGAALDARPLRTLVLAASRLHRLEPDALASMILTLASLDLGHNEFTEVPVEALSDLKVLNWLNLQSNRIADLDPDTDWGFLADSLSSLSLANNQLCSLGAGAFSALRELAHLDLEGNRLHAIEPRALPSSLVLLRLSDNLLPALPCAALAQLPRLRHLHLRGNALRAALDSSAACRAGATVDSLDLAMNELDDTFELAPQSHPQLRRLILDLNDFTAIPPWVQEGGARLERLSLSHNRVSRVSVAAAHALRALARLDLDHNALLTPPDALRTLSALRRLDLAHNLLRELPHPPPHLRYLSLAGNLFAALPMGLWRLAPATLAYLDLGYNRISALSADSFGAWSDALGALNLRGNHLARLAVNAFPPTLPLRELVLSFNDLDRVERGAFANLTELRMLELSSTLFGGEFPAAAADGVTWLSLDNDDIHRVSADDLLGFPSLEYLNLDFNKITAFPGEAIRANGTSRLKELRLAYNYLSAIDTDFLRAAPELQSVDLSYNRIRNVSVRAFNELPALRHLSLAGNLLADLAPCAFCAVPRLEVLDLHDNRLTELSAASFELLSGERGELTVNASRNSITRLRGGGVTAAVTALDLSHNRLDALSSAFFAALGGRLARLTLTNNRLAHLDAASLGALPRLRVLALGNGYVIAIKRRTLADAPALQTIDLSRNAIEQLAVEQFHGLRDLRHLRLGGNRLRSLPRDCLRNTVLEHLDLADNQLALFPASALAAVGFTLRRLELARNRLSRLDAAMFRACTELRELSLAGNRLTALADDALAPLSRLIALDLSGNRLEANFRELLRSAPRLRRLALADTELRAAPALPLPELVELDLSGNRIATLREADARQLTRLRALLLARNAFTSLRPAVWAALPRLVALDASDNPIARLARGSLEGLPRLRSLRLERLRRLEAVEPRAFLPLSSLRELALEVPLGRGGARVADVVGCTPALEALTLTVRAPVLEAQLRGLRAGRMRELELRGVALRVVSRDAFAALGAARALTLRLRGTRVARLPAGLVQPLARVPHLALDFSDNELVEFAPAVLYRNATGRSRLGTRLLPGGLVVGGNPLRCGCAVAWVGAWLRRWTAEVGGWSRQARAAARASGCVADGAGSAGGAGGAGHARLALVALEQGEAECGASALSSRAPRAALPVARPTRASPAPAFLWMILLHSVS